MVFGQCQKIAALSRLGAGLGSDDAELGLALKGYLGFHFRQLAPNLPFILSSILLLASLSFRLQQARRIT